MNRRLGGDASLNAPIRDDGDSGEWQDWLVDDSASQETSLAESEESDNRRQALADALGVLNERERRIFEARRLADEPITLEELADRIRRVARARAPDRGARLREGAEGGEEPRRRDGSPAGGGGALSCSGVASVKAGSLRPGFSRFLSYFSHAANASWKARSPGVPFSMARMARRLLV